MASKWREFTKKSSDENKVLSVYRDNKFIGAIENTSASCDIFHKMNTAYTEALELIGELEYELKFYVNSNGDNGPARALLKIKAFKDRGSE